ncbi:MAG: hypothetical protein V1833_06385, partial [Elusimicrobiota bacterium]
MKLIKNFKVILRQGYVFRELKRKKVQISENEQTQKLTEIQQKIISATIYETFNTAVFGKKIELGKSISVSLFAVTLGKEIETLPKDEIIEASVKDGLEVAKNFALKLIQ